MLWYDIICHVMIWYCMVCHIRINVKNRKNKNENQKTISSMYELSWYSTNSTYPAESRGQSLPLAVSASLPSTYEVRSDQHIRVSTYSLIKNIEVLTGDRTLSSVLGGNSLQIFFIWSSVTHTHTYIHTHAHTPVRLRSQCSTHVPPRTL